MKIENAKTKIFTDKQHYLDFIATWKKVANKKDGTLQAEHHILYNILREKSIYNGFTPITNVNKLTHGHYINHGLYFGYSQLQLILNGAVKAHTDNANLNKWAKERIDQFIGVFEGTLTVEMLYEVSKVLPEIQPLYSDYGKGKQIAEQIIKGDRFTFDQLVSNMLKAA